MSCLNEMLSFIGGKLTEIWHNQHLNMTERPLISQLGILGFSPCSIINYTFAYWQIQGVCSYDFFYASISLESYGYESYWLNEKETHVQIWLRPACGPNLLKLHQVFKYKKMSKEFYFVFLMPENPHRVDVQLLW